jgi:flagellar motor protein MotB
VKIANFLLASAAICAVPFTVHAEEPDLPQLQQQLATERQKLDDLAKATEQALQSQQQLKDLQQQNAQLSADILKLREQAQAAESRAANAEADRDHARADLATIKTLIAKAVQSAIPVEPPAANAETMQPTPPLPANRPATSPKRQIVRKAPVVVKAPKVETAAAEPGQNLDERAILGGRSAAMSFDGLPEDRRQEAQKLVGSLNATADERGLVTTLPGELLFAPGSDMLETHGHDPLDRVAELARIMRNQNVRIVGHTAGDPKLAQDQAAAVSQYLIDHQHIQARRLAVAGSGDAQAGSGGTVEVIIQN